MQVTVRLAVAMAAAAFASSPVAAGLTDTVDLSSPASTAAHSFEKQGRVATRVTGDIVGHNNERRAAVEVGPLSSITFQMRVVPGKAITLEFEEMYGRDTLVRGYSVLVDGKATHFRTWQGCGAGPVHYFVQAPPTPNRAISVTLRNEGSAPFVISRAWAFGEFDHWFDANKMAVPYFVAPLVSPSFRDEKADLAELDKIKRSLGAHPNIKPAFTAAIAYAAFGPSDVRQRIEWVLRLARLSKMPVQIEFDTWWAQTPSGLDGKGGQWSDAPYIQVVYNATKKRYQLSVPNQWSSTPWLTTNNRTLNAYKQRRMAEAMSVFRRAFNAMCVDGHRNLLLAVNLDNEPVYWANGNAGLGEDLLQADFNPAAVAAAKKDGVTLDPADGLSRRERLWLFKNLARYNGMIADAAWKGLQRDATIVSPAGVQPANDLSRYNVFTQAMVGAPDIQYPMLSAAYPFWETAAPLRARAGGEWNGDTLVEREAVERQLALGRNAAVNAECGNDASNMQSVKPGYALAQRFVALYNYPLDKMDAATAGIRDLTQPFPAFVYQPVVLEERFVDDTWKQHAVEYGGLQSGLIGNTAAVAIYPTSTESPGFITWALHSAEGKWDSLALELDGRAFNFGKTDPSVHVRVLAGPTKDPGSMRELARLHDGSITPADRVDLSPVAKGLNSVYVRLEFHAPTIPSTVLSWCSIYKARFTTGWPQGIASGVKQDESLATVRKHNLVVSWRRDAERAMADMASHRPNTKAARTAYDRGEYSQCYRIANRALCAALPATFVVKQGGVLKPYPIRVRSQAAVTVVVQACSAREVRLSLRGESSATVNVTVGGLTMNARYTALPEGDGWVLTRISSGKGTVSSGPRGEFTFSAAVVPFEKPPSKRTLSGIYAGSTANGFLLKGDNGLETMRTSPATVYDVSGQHGPRGASLGDDEALSVDVGADGAAAVVRAFSEELDGTVKEFGQVTPFVMPFIGVGGGHAIPVSMDAMVHTPGVEGRIRAIPLGTVDIKPGDRVRVRVNPVLKRAVEIWKL